MEIEQPKDKTVYNGEFGAALKWDSSFGKNKTETFSLVQQYVDQQCIQLMRQYTPSRNNILVKSVTLGTVIGSGEIRYASPYARYQYYGKLMVSSITGSAFAARGESKVLTEKDLVYNKARHPLAQRLWFETMKHNHKEQILRGAAAIARREK